MSFFYLEWKVWGQDVGQYLTDKFILIKYLAMGFESNGSGSLERSVHYSQWNYSIYILGLDEILLEARRLDNPAVVLDSNQTSDCLEHALIDCRLTDNPEIQDEEFEVGCELLLSPEYLSANPEFDQAFEKYLHDSNYGINDLIVSPLRDNLYYLRDQKLGTNFIILLENQRFILLIYIWT